MNAPTPPLNAAMEMPPGSGKVKVKSQYAFRAGSVLIIPDSSYAGAIGAALWGGYRHLKLLEKKLVISEA